MNIAEKVKSRCWSAEGVWGTSDCPRLAQVGHCHNCEVFAQAGKSFLESLKSDNHSKGSDLKNGSVESPVVVKKSSKEFACLLFKCKDFNLALAMDAVREVADERPIHRIPHKQSKVLSGLVNINGELIMTIDILALFNTGCVDCPNYRLIVCASGEDKYAFKASSVIGMASVDVAEISSCESDGAMGVFLEKSLTVNSTKFMIIDFDLLVHALTRKYL